MVSWFLLHDPSVMHIEGVSGQRKFIIGRRMLEGHRHCQEVFYILEGLLGRGGPFQCFGPPPSGDRSKFSELVHSWAKNSGKSLSCQENVAVVWCPEGVGNFRSWQRDRLLGPLLSPKSYVQGFQGRVLQKHIFPSWWWGHWRLMLWKKPPDGGGVFACLESRLVSRPCLHTWTTHLPDHLWCDPLFFEKFVRRWTAQKGWTNTQTGQMALWLQFLGCPRSQQGFGDDIWQDWFLKKLCNHAGSWKGPACLVKDTCPGLSPNLKSDNRHKDATIHLFWAPCAKGKPMANLTYEQCQQILTFSTLLWLLVIFLDRCSGTLQKQGGGYRCAFDAWPHG